MESILDTIKAMLGIKEEYPHFDEQIKVYINSAFAVLTQHGVGPWTGFSIKGKEETWADFEPGLEGMDELVKQYVYMKVKLVFDPPESQGLLKAMEEQVKECEWRMMEMAEENRGEAGDTLVDV